MKSISKMMGFEPYAFASWCHNYQLTKYATQEKHVLYFTLNNNSVKIFREFLKKKDAITPKHCRLERFNIGLRRLRAIYEQN
jgi:hypothetical protein